MTPKETRKKLCRDLYELAKLKGISQQVISDRTGIARYNVSRMLSGQKNITLDNFIKLSKAIDCHIKLIDD